MPDDFSLGSDDPSFSMGTGGGSCSSSRVNCSSFSTQEEAQQYMAQNGAYHLDRDSDGIACEHLPSMNGSMGASQGSCSAGSNGPASCASQCNEKCKQAMAAARKALADGGCPATVRPRKKTCRKKRRTCTTKKRCAPKKKKTCAKKCTRKAAKCCKGKKCGKSCIQKKKNCPPKRCSKRC